MKNTNYLLSGPGLPLLSKLASERDTFRTQDRSTLSLVAIIDKCTNAAIPKSLIPGKSMDQYWFRNGVMKLADINILETHNLQSLKMVDP